MEETLKNLKLSIQENIKIYRWTLIILCTMVIAGITASFLFSNTIQMVSAVGTLLTAIVSSINIVGLLNLRAQLRIHDVLYQQYKQAEERNPPSPPTPQEVIDKMISNARVIIAFNK